MTATMPTSTGMKPCRLYRFYVAHPVTGKRVLGYVGETWQMPFDRLMQHVRDQPWADTMLGWELDPVVYYGKRAVLDAEAAAIRDERPLYNVKGNERNDKRIIPPLAIRQRRDRDAAQDAPRWVHPADRMPDSPKRPAVARVRGRRGMTRRGITTSWAIAWLANAAMTLGFLMRHGIGDASQKAWVVGAVPTGLVAFGYYLGPQAWKCLKRSTRRWIRDLF